MSTTEEGPEAGTDEVTTKVTWLTLNFPQGLLEPEFTTTCCCLQGSPGALWVHVLAVEGSCSSALGGALRANTENSLVGIVKGVLLVWWLGGYPLRPSTVYLRRQFSSVEHCTGPLVSWEVAPPCWRPRFYREPRL